MTRLSSRSWPTHKRKARNRHSLEIMRKKRSRATRRATGIAVYPFPIYSDEARQSA